MVHVAGEGHRFAALPAILVFQQQVSRTILFEAQAAFTGQAPNAFSHCVFVKGRCGKWQDFA